MSNNRGDDWEDASFFDHIKGLVKGALEDHCTSFCMDNKLERDMTAFFIARRLIERGVVQK